MTDMNQSIEIARNLILTEKDKEKYMLYPYTTENLIGLFNEIDVAGKECLTINGSFDQSLDMALMNAKSITAFDINPLTLPYAELKMSLLLTGYKKEIYFGFLNGYYDVLEEIALHPKIFAYISQNLSTESFTFWQTLLENFDKRQICQKLFYDGYHYSEQRNFVNYMQNDNYQKLQEKLPNTNIKLLESDIKTLPSTLNKNYDIIHFSNISGYPNTEHKGKNREEKLWTYKDLIETYSLFLNEGGKIISYIYDPFNNQGCDEPPIFDINLREHVFSGDEYSYIYFPGYFQDAQDGCLIYTKQKR